MGALRILVLFGLVTNVLLAEHSDLPAPAKARGADVDAKPSVPEFLADAVEKRKENVADLTRRYRAFEAELKDIPVESPEGAASLRRLSHELETAKAELDLLGRAERLYSKAGFRFVSDSRKRKLAQALADLLKPKEVPKTRYLENLASPTRSGVVIRLPTERERAVSALKENIEITEEIVEAAERARDGR